MDVTPGATPYFSGEHSDAEESPPRILSSHDHQLGDEDVEQAPLILWLISRCRNSDALSRLMAISLLTNLFRVGLAGKKLVNLLVLLVLPILVRLLDEENPNNPQSEYHRGGAMVGGVVPSRKNEWIIRERAPAILADLVNDNEQMQKAAVDAGAVKKLAAMLKRTFEVPPSSSPGKETNGVLSLQNSERNSDRSADASHNASLKDDGNSPFKIHRMKVRESTLRCLAGLASCKDEYRKLVIEAGVVPYIVAALRPNKLASTIPEAFSSAGKEISDAPNIVKEGNPPRVLIAAAYAIKSLSRSVSVLRTSLADAGIPSPLFDLLKGEDIEVKIAGTMALCNLVLEFSPMRTVSFSINLRS